MTEQESDGIFGDTLELCEKKAARQTGGLSFCWTNNQHIAGLLIYVLFCCICSMFGCVCKVADLLIFNRQTSQMISTGRGSSSLPLGHGSALSWVHVRLPCCCSEMWAMFVQTLLVLAFGMCVNN